MCDDLNLGGCSAVEGTDGGESIVKLLVGAVRFCYRESAFVLRLQSMEQDSSLLSLRGQLFLQGCRDGQVGSTHLGLKG